MFLRKERPLALLPQLGGVCLLAYDLLVTDPHVSGGAALVGFAVFLVGARLSRMRLLKATRGAGRQQGMTGELKLVLTLSP
jgi:hypothetical protein